MLRKTMPTWIIGTAVFVLLGSGGPALSPAADPRAAAANRQDAAQASAAEVPRQEYKSSGDPDENVTKLLKEKLEALRQREELVRTAFAANKATQRQMDHATLRVLQAELEVLEKPSLRIATHEKIITILKAQEVQAEKDFRDQSAKPGRSSDPSSMIWAFSRVVSVKVDRIDAELALERERSDLQKEMASQAGGKK